MADTHCQAEQLREQGNMLALAGDMQGAVAVLKQALLLQPASAVLLEMLAQVLMESGQYEDAYTAAGQATDLAPNWADGWLTLGRTARNSQHFHQAIKAFVRCQHLEAQNMDVSAEIEDVKLLLQQQIAASVGLPQLHIQQDVEGSTGPGCVAWDSGVLLARYLLGYPSQIPVRRKKVLELGSGTGLVGIVAACKGAEVTLTDLPEVLPLLSKNMQANEELVNAAQGSMIASTLDWTSSALEVCDQSFDLVIGADLVYNTTSIQYLTQLFKLLLKANPACEVLLSHKSRHTEVDTQLFAYLKGIGLQLVPVAKAGDSDVTVYLHSHRTV